MNPSSTHRARVGIIGVGAMGMAMALNLHGRGWQVSVRDLRPEADRQARAAGLHVCASPQALAAEVDIAILVVVNAAQIEDVLFGVDGVTSAEPGARTVMLCSTIAPQDTRRFAARLALHGIVTLDAPISGGPARALAGTMSTMLAAPPAVLAPWQELLADLAAKRFVVSETVGDAATAKLVNNLLAGINLVAGAEALSLAGKIGLDQRAVFELIRASSGNSWVFEDRMARALVEDYSPPRAAAHILTKDMGLATALAASVGHATPLGDAAWARLRETVARGWAELDDAAVIKTYQADGGDRVSPPAEPITLASGYQPGVVGRVAEMHASFYSAAVGFGQFFESQVATGVAEFAARLEQPRNGLWTAMRAGRIVGSIAIDGEDLGGDAAHLRWFIVDNGLRTTGVGRQLLAAALDFCQAQGFASVHLWTFRGLDAARRLYERAGFALVEERPGRRWGAEVVEQRFVR